eukprot:6016729-Prymnesium_polylepis.1
MPTHRHSRQRTSHRRTHSRREETEHCTLASTHSHTTHAKGTGTAAPQDAGGVVRAGTYIFHKRAARLPTQAPASGGQ